MAFCRRSGGGEGSVVGVRIISDLHTINTQRYDHSPRE